MARKSTSTTEVAKLLEFRNSKIEQISQIADQMQHLRDTAGTLQLEIEKLDFALSYLAPDHVPMDAQSSTSGRLLIDAQPAKVETKAVEAAAIPVKPVEEPAAKPVAAKKAATKAKKGSAAKTANTRKAKSEPVPQTAVAAAKEIKGTRSNSKNEKELRAREVINGYVADFKAADEIEAILKKGPDRGMTVNEIADVFVQSHPLPNADDKVVMVLKNRISSQVAHLMKKGLVSKAKVEGETLTHYSARKENDATPAKTAASSGSEAAQASA
jgi:hypothetical protein